MHQKNLPGAEPEVTNSPSTSSDDHGDTNSATEFTSNDHTSSSCEVSTSSTGPTTSGHMGNGVQHASSVSGPTSHGPTGNGLSIFPAAAGGLVEVQTHTLPLQLPLGHMALAPSTVLSTNLTQSSTQSWALVTQASLTHTSTQVWAPALEANLTHASTQSWALVTQASLTHTSTQVWAPALEANLTHASTQAPTPVPDLAATLPLVAANRTFGFGVPTLAPALVQVPASTLDPAPVWATASVLAPVPVLTFVPPFTLPVAPVPAPASVPAPAPVPAPAFAVAEHPVLAQTHRRFPVLAPTFSQPLLPLPTFVRARIEGQAMAPALASALSQAAEAATPQPQDAFSETVEEALAAPSGPKTNLIVNHLPPSMTQEEFYRLFAGMGEIRCYKLMRDKVTGQSLGYGFIDYVHARDAEKAIYLMNGVQCLSKTIKVSYARPLSSSIQYANLYVSGLPKTMTRNELEQLFSPFGHIVASKILADRFSGASQGVAFIRFNTRSEAEQAIKALNGQKPSSIPEPLVVKFAHHQTLKTSQSLLWQPPQDDHGPLQPQTSRLEPNDFSPSSFDVTTHPGLTSNGWCIFIYNLPPESDEIVLWELFGPFGAVKNVKIIRDFNTKKCKRFGFVTMTSYDEAALAVANLNGYCLDGHVLQVSFKTSKIHKA